MAAISASQARTMQNTSISDDVTKLGPSTMDYIYTVIEMAASKDKISHCEVNINPVLKSYVLNQLFTQGYFVDSNQGGDRLTISW